MTASASAGYAMVIVWEGGRGAVEEAAGDVHPLLKGGGQQALYLRGRKHLRANICLAASVLPARQDSGKIR